MEGEGAAPMGLRTAWAWHHMEGAGSCRALLTRQLLREVQRIRRRVVGRGQHHDRPVLLVPLPSSPRLPPPLCTPKRLARPSRLPPFPSTHTSPLACDSRATAVRATAVRATAVRATAVRGSSFAAQAETVGGGLPAMSRQMVGGWLPAMRTDAEGCVTLYHQTPSPSFSSHPESLFLVTSRVTLSRHIPSHSFSPDPKSCRMRPECVFIMCGSPGGSDGASAPPCCPLNPPCCPLIPRSRRLIPPCRTLTARLRCTSAVATLAASVSSSLLPNSNTWSTDSSWYAAPPSSPGCAKRTRARSDAETLVQRSGKRTGYTADCGSGAKSDR
eukprot:14262-Chlamydomonas_euryale.AAC.1